MKLISKQNLIIKTNMPKAEILEALEIYTVKRDRRPSIFNYYKSKLFWGCISDYNFNIIPIVDNRNSIRPTIEGKFKYYDEYTVINVNIDIPTLAQLPLLIIIIIVFFIPAAFLIIAVLERPISLLHLLSTITFLFLPTCIILIIQLIFNYESKKVIKKLLYIFEGTLEKN